MDNHSLRNNGCSLLRKGDYIVVNSPWTGGVAIARISEIHIITVPDAGSTYDVMLPERRRRRVVWIFDNEVVRRATDTEIKEFHLRSIA